MKILSIETSCDETGISILENQGGVEITLLGNALASQIELHAKYGGVFPAMAKRAHVEKMVPLITEALEQADMLTKSDTLLTPAQLESLEVLTEKESVLKELMTVFFQTYNKPDLDYIAVTVGPGLEPALWVGVNAAKALSLVWGIPIIPINHMEGHIVTGAIEKIEAQDLNDFSGPRVVSGLNQTQKNPSSPSLRQKYQFTDLSFPVLALLVSGGHTELVLADSFGVYHKIGQTRDDAVGEAFDKVARMLGLPYPGGPAVSKLAATYRSSHLEVELPSWLKLPRPMLHSGDYDFSFSGIKTATLYTIRDLGRELTEEERQAIACEFEDAVVEVLIKKTLKAATEYHTPTIIVGGGVAGNSYLRSRLIQAAQANLADTTVLFPEPWLATDNAVMIGLAAMTQVLSGNIKTASSNELKADGNLSL